MACLVDSSQLAVPSCPERRLKKLRGGKVRLGEKQELAKTTHTLFPMARPCMLGRRAPPLPSKDAVYCRSLETRKRIEQGDLMKAPNSFFMPQFLSLIPNLAPP